MRNSIKKFFSPKVVKNLVTLATIALVSGAVVTGIVADPSVTAGDCDSNAIIRCGINSRSELVSRYKALDSKGQKAYVHAGVNLYKVDGTVEGYVTSDNRVVVGGKTVANNAYTYGRGYMKGSTQIGGGAYMRHPSVSFRSKSIPAFVYMENGTFKWAVIKSCGNPVKATPNTPPAKPSQNIVKRVTTNVTVGTDTAYIYGKQSVQANRNQIVRFVSQASNTGNVDISGFVSDKLPAGTSFYSGRYVVKEKGREVKSGNVARAQDGSYGYLGVLKPGAEVKLDIKAKYNTTSTVRNIACIQTSQAGKKCDDAYVTSPPKTPTAKCESLVAKQLSTTKYQFTTKASVKDGAKVTGYVYDFGDDKTQTVNTSALTNTVEHTFAKSQKYAVKVTIKTSVGNKTCYTTAPVNIPTAKCESLVPTKLSYSKFRFTTKAAVSNGAKVTGYVYDFGDDKTQTVNTSALTNTVEHTYAKSWKYAVKVTVKTTAGNRVCYTSAEVNIPTPGVTITKKVDGVKQKEVAVGQDFTYQIVVKNSGQVNLTNVVVGDVAPAGVTLKSADKGTIKAPVNWNYTIPQLNINQSATFNIVATVKSYKAGSLKNIACVNAKEVNPTKPNVVDACGDATVTVKKQTPKIQIEKTSSIKDGVEGQVFDYRLAVKNTGQVTLRNAKVTDTAPAGITFRSADRGSVASNGKSFSYTIPELKVGQVVNIKISAKVTGATGSVKNIACVDAVEIPGVKDDCDDVIIIVKKPSVIIDKKVDGVDRKEVEVGQEFTYQIKVTNNGNVDLKNARVYDVPPAGVTLLSASEGQVKQGTGPSPYGVLNGTYWTTTIPELKIGQSKSFTIKAVVKSYKAGDLKNIACVDAKEVNPNVIDGNDDCDDAIVTVKNNTPNVTIDKKVNGVQSKEVKLNQEFTYQLVVKNTGNVTVTNGVVTDVAPEGVQFISTDKGTVTGNKLNYTISSLAPGSSVNINIKAKVTAYKTGNIVNTACVNAKEVNPNEPAKQDDCDDAIVTVEKETTPKFACEELKVTSIDKDDQLPYDVRFDAKASATDGAVIQGYIWNFGDSKTIETTNATVNHSYTAVGNYTATVQVKTSAGTTAISSKCSVAVKVTEKTPVIECKDLKVELSGTVAPITAKFTVTAKVENAVVESYIFSFGDGSADVASAASTTTHTYAKAGEYTASAKIKTDKGTTETGNCKVVIKANEKPVCPYNPNLPIDHPDCKEVVTPPTPPTPPKQPTPEAPIQEVMPSILPKTGTEAVAVMGGTGMMFGAARIYAGSRKERLSKLLRR
jgi:uncharacterized repeat protein (TIGR01451 family)